MIISGGSIQREFASGFLKEEKADRIIAADSGLAFCEAENIVPDVILGDFDSISPACAARYHLNALQNGEKKHVMIQGKEVLLERFRPQKDATDTELAVEKACSLGADEVILLGATGSRLDHVLGNIALLYRMLQKGVRGWMVDRNCRVRVVQAGTYVIRRDGQFGNYLSIVPYGGAVEGLTITGTAYPLAGHTVHPGEESLCVSNQITEEQAGISFDKGAALIIESRD